MHYFSIDENKNKTHLAYKRHFWHGLPRAIVSCRVLDHTPRRVDLKYGRDNAYYYECRRCGARPRPQTDENAPWEVQPGGLSFEWWVLPKKIKNEWGLNFRVGHAGSERTFKGHVSTPVAAAYWGIERYGEGLRKLLNSNDDYETRVTYISYHSGKFYTQIWAKQNSWSSKDPWWMHGSWSPKDTLFGKRKMSREIVKTQPVVIPMAEGGYPAIAKLERVTVKRPRGRAHISYSCEVKIDDPVSFIPVPGKGENSWDCGDDGVWSMTCPITNERDWVAEAISAMVKSALRDRERYAGKNWAPAAGWAEGLVHA